MSDDRRIHLFDSTLRDGAQTQGVDFGIADKAAVARALDRLGIDYVEGGWPGANPTDDAFFAEPPALANAKFTAFGMTRRPGRSAQNDPGLAALVDARAPVVCIVGKTWDFHVEQALGVSLEENIAMIADSIAHLAASKDEAMFDCRAFFRRLQGQSRLRARLRPKPPMRPAPAGWCCATPMAARSPMEIDRGSSPR